MALHIQSTNPVRSVTVMSVAATCVALLAHQGGWDEALLIAGPILAIVGLLILAKRRVDAAGRAQSPDVDGHDEPGAADDRSMSAPTERNRPTKSS
jgi:hypothetical protein